MKIKIDGQFITFFNEISINLTLDSIASSFSFRARFNPENDLHKELFKPLQYKKVEIYNSKEKLMFTGLILNHSFVSDAGRNLVSISGYSSSGVLEDVTIPTSAYPLESIGSSLKNIAQKLCKIYGVGLVIDSSVAGLCDQVFESTAASPTDTVKGYLAKLTSQKNIILSHDARGNVVMFKPNDAMKPNYFFNKDNTLEMTASYNGQGMHSHINCVRQPSDENEGAEVEDSITNPLIKVYRPTTKILTSGEDTDTSKAADNELAAELKNIARTVKLKGIFDDIKPGDIVNVHSHDTYSFAYSRFMVAGIQFSIDEKTEITDLSLVLPETYTGKKPRDILFYYATHLRDV